MSCVVYSQLSVAAVGGTVHQLVKEYENDKNGYTAWNTLCEWYNGDAVNNEKVESLRYNFGRITSCIDVQRSTLHK